MKYLEFDEVDRDEIIQCLNCTYTDIAGRWKGKEGNCPECGSKAFKIYSEPLFPLP